MDDLTDGTAFFLAISDCFFLCFFWTLEELADVGDGIVLLEEGEKFGVCDALSSFLEIKELWLLVKDLTIANF